MSYYNSHINCLIRKIRNKHNRNNSANNNAAHIEQQRVIVNQNNPHQNRFQTRYYGADGRVRKDATYNSSADWMLRFHMKPHPADLLHSGSEKVPVAR